MTPMAYLFYCVYGFLCYVSVAELFDRGALDLRVVNFLQGLETTGPRLDPVVRLRSSSTRLRNGRRPIKRHADAVNGDTTGMQSGNSEGSCRFSGAEVIRSSGRPNVERPQLVLPVLMAQWSQLRAVRFPWSPCLITRMQRHSFMRDYRSSRQEAADNPPKTLRQSNTRSLVYLFDRFRSS